MRRWYWVTRPPLRHHFDGHRPQQGVVVVVLALLFGGVVCSSNKFSANCGNRFKQKNTCPDYCGLGVDNSVHKPASLTRLGFADRALF